MKTITCADISDARRGEYLDGKLDDAMAAQIDEHVADCTACQVKLEPFFKPLEELLRETSQRDFEILQAFERGELPKPLPSVRQRALEAVLGVHQMVAKWGQFFVTIVVSIGKVLGETLGPAREARLEAKGKIQEQGPLYLLGRGEYADAFHIDLGAYEASVRLEKMRKDFKVEVQLNAREKERNVDEELQIDFYDEERQRRGPSLSPIAGNVTFDHLQPGVYKLQITRGKETIGTVKLKVQPIETS